MWKERVPNVPTLIAVGLIAATAMVVAAPLGWPFELASHFPLQLGIVALFCAVWCARMKAGGAVLVAVMVFGLQVAILAPMFLESSAPRGAGDVRILTANVLYRSDDYDAMMKLVAAEHPDVVIIVEETPAWQAGLAELSRTYPYQEHSGATVRVRGMSGVGVYSKTPLSVVPMGDIPNRDERPALAVGTTLAGKEVTLVAVHPWTPHTPDAYKKRNDQLAALAEFTASRGEYAIMVGDMNITPHSPDFGPILTSYGLRNAREGMGWAPSWPAPLPWLGIPIDHAFVTAGIKVLDFRMGPFIGSDHYPTILDFSVEGGGV